MIAVTLAFPDNAQGLPAGVSAKNPPVLRDQLGENFMRTVLTLALGLMFVGAGAGFADDKPINTVCPKSGKAADGSHVAKVKDGDKAITVATCCNGCAGKVEADPAKYVAAAKANKKAE